jgi:hypothetical protein
MVAGLRRASETRGRLEIGIGGPGIHLREVKILPGGHHEITSMAPIRLYDEAGDPKITILSKNDPKSLFLGILGSPGCGDPKTSIGA